jgi:septum formation protein
MQNSATAWDNAGCTALFTPKPISMSSSLPSASALPEQTPAPSHWPKLVLGSTSPYRKELLTRLGLPFDTCAPGTAEHALANETPRDLAWRLAQAKAQDVSQHLQGMQPDQDLLVIGSDQVAELRGQALGKPGTHDKARQQLQAMCGQTVLFHTAVCLARPCTGYFGTRLSTVSVTFRALSDLEIETYLHAEQPYDCAGSAKAEGLGIALLDRIQSDDPSALIGLPLIDTCNLMRDAGIDPLHWLAALRQSTP